MHLGQYARWQVCATFITLGILFGLEMAGVFVRHYITLTELVQMYIPLWLRAAIIAALAWHFLVQYK